MDQQLKSESIFFNPQTSLIDHPDKISLIVYTRKCNWQCFGCYNMRYLLKDDYVEAIKKEEIISLMNSSIVDMLIISGGESMLLGQQLVDNIKFIKENTKKPIRIDTNGTQYETAKQLVDEKLVDGFAVDVKYPYWLPATSLLYSIIGVNIIDTDSILKTMKLADTLPYSLFRTVKYPILSESIVSQICSYMKTNYKSPHMLNPFYHMS